MKKNLFTYKKSGVDISAADKFVKYISNISSKQKGKKHGSKNSIRLFTTEEKNKIPNHCLNKLNELCLYKIITPKDRELIIVQAMAIKQNKLTDEHFHWICQMVITNQPTKDLSQSNEQDNKKDILRFVLQKDKMEITAH